MVGTIERTKETSKQRQRNEVLEMINTDINGVHVSYIMDTAAKLKKIRHILNWSEETRLAMVTITPEMASKMLEFNEKNRKVIKTAVNKYSQSLIDGDFTISNDMITFDNEGILTNGQHRLLAVVKTGLPLTVVVMIGVPQSSEMDRGAKRNIIDNVMLTGNLDVRLCNANIVKVCKALFDHLQNRSNYTCNQLEIFMNNNADAIETAYNNNLLVLQGKEKYVFNVQIAAAFLAAVIYYSNKYCNNEQKFNQCMDTLVHIRDVLTTSVADSVDDRFIIRLRDKIKDGRKDHRRLTADAIFRSTQYCIYHYVNGDTRNLILCNKDYFI